MELEQLLPENSEFTLSSSDKTYTLRSPNIEDRMFFAKRFGETGIRNAFEKRNWEIISIVVMRLLTDRSDFLIREFDDIDEDGRQVKRQITGPEVLRTMIKTIKDQVAVLGAISAAFINGDPEMKEAVQKEVKKKMKEDVLDGTKSLIDSLANMDGKQNISSAEL